MGVARSIGCALLMATAFAGAVAPVVAVASPPVGIKGIDIGTVLTVSDWARAAQVRSQGPRGRRTLQAIRTVVIDPGHGGDNHGARGVAEVDEKSLTLELAYALRDRLQRRHPELRVVLTRYWDESLELDDRIRLANLRGADLFLSLHYNAASHDHALGVETFYLAQGEPPHDAAPAPVVANALEQARALIAQSQARAADADPMRHRPHPQSQALAVHVQQELVGRLDAVDRGVKRAHFGVLRGARMPAVVVESGFLSHPHEGHAVVTVPHRRRLVRALVTAIEKFDKAMAATTIHEDEDP